MIKKFARVVSRKEGGISELKVTLHIRNRSNRPQKHIRVVDNTPNLIDVIKDFDVGTLSPDKIVKHERRGTTIEWEIDEFVGKEERLITYKVRAKLSILGNFLLPKCTVLYVRGKKTKRTVSNVLKMIARK